ncbi:MAG: hydroxyacylglutathione hydrolase [Rickettsiales bacterium]|nr:hydroxyacylglutathione hydrolase [Rickettsiales bacterium]|tara:strand:+ start:4429 stop:5088 length:660 start_codon:yes stop_codon:yes gene_type:complete
MFGVNTYLITDRATGAAAVIDTGESDELVGRIKGLATSPDIQMILLTHGHLDHAGALASLQEHWDVPTWMDANELPLFNTLPFQATAFGMPHIDCELGRVDNYIKDGGRVELGETTLRFLATPGHTPGMGCWYDETDIFVGDTLFAGSIGRTDFPMSDPSLMVDSLRRLMQLPGHLRVHSGHGPVTTLEHELLTNPFLGYLRSELGIAGPPGFSWTAGT